MIGRADIEGSKSNVAMNAWLPQASSVLPQIIGDITGSHTTRTVGRSSEPTGTLDGGSRDPARVICRSPIQVRGAAQKSSFTPERKQKVLHLPVAWTPSRVGVARTLSSSPRPSGLLRATHTLASVEPPSCDRQGARSAADRPIIYGLLPVCPHIRGQRVLPPWRRTVNLQGFPASRCVAYCILSASGGFVD